MNCRVDHQCVLTLRLNISEQEKLFLLLLMSCISSLIVTVLYHQEWLNHRQYNLFYYDVKMYKTVDARW